MSRAVANPFLLLAIALTISACSAKRATVHEARFQKRHFRGGWHVDLDRRAKSSASPRSSEFNPSELDVRSSLENRSPEPAGMRTDLISSEQTRSTGPIPKVQEAPIASTDRTYFESPTLTANEDPWVATIPTSEDEKPPKIWNKWAIPAFILALGTVAYGFLGTSPVILVLAVAATLILAIIAVRKGRRYEWSGKGFAIGAMIIGFVSALITLIALLNGSL